MAMEARPKACSRRKLRVGFGRMGCLMWRRRECGRGGWGGRILRRCGELGNPMGGWGRRAPQGPKRRPTEIQFWGLVTSREKSGPPEERPPQFPVPTDRRARHAVPLRGAERSSGGRSRSGSSGKAIEADDGRPSWRGVNLVGGWEACYSLGWSGGGLSPL
jgi:hypothetical protein